MTVKVDYSTLGSEILNSIKARTSLSIAVSNLNAKKKYLAMWDKTNPDHIPIVKQAEKEVAEYEFAVQQSEKYFKITDENRSEIYKALKIK